MGKNSKDSRGTEKLVVNNPLAAEKPKPLRIHIRWMIRRDLAECLDIEFRSFEFPWCEEEFIRTLRQRNCIAMVAEHDDRVIGYFFYELSKRYLRLVNFATHPAFCRRTVARQMIDKMKAKLSSQRRVKIIAEVRETNLAALLFLKSQGFRAVQVLRDFYERQFVADDRDGEDAVVMEYRYGGSEWEAANPAAAILEKTRVKPGSKWHPTNRWAALMPPQDDECCGGDESRCDDEGDGDCC